MAASVGVNLLSIVNEDTKGVSIAFPDVCKTPAPPAGPIPIPYPNIAKSSDTAKGTKKVKVEGKPVCVKDSKVDPQKHSVAQAGDARRRLEALSDTLRVEIRAAGRASPGSSLDESFSSPADDDALA